MPPEPDWYEGTRALLRAHKAEEVAKAGPPCVRCKWWRPAYDAHHNAIQLCATQFGQYQDFSCFEPEAPRAA